MNPQNPSGIVYLVGAGPGDPGLITVRGARLLEQAQVVVYDALVNPSLLSYCPQADYIYVGKRSNQHTMTQDQINAVLVEHGGAGKLVVRLKGGDPFVFGRGGEEAEALVQAGVRFEVVPGITASIAAPAYAGIPVTHRDFNTSFTFITGHERDDGTDTTGIDWSAVAKLPCVAFYMGIKSLPNLCRRLVEHGMNPQTPAATIQWGTRSMQRTVVATVSDLPQKVVEAKIGAPALTIIGRVVELRKTLNWFESRPLFGQTILVTRTRQQASELSEKLQELGANVLEAPTIELSPPKDWKQVDVALRELSKFDWIVFTSANGVTHAKRRLMELGLDARAFGGARIAVIGDATGRAVNEMLGLRVDLCPKSFVAEALADELMQSNQVQGKRFCLLRADIARPVLREQLEKASAAEVRDVAVYETHQATALPLHVLEALDARQVTWITFTSGSTARNLVHLLGTDYRARLSNIKLASIGPITTATLRELGLAPTIEAADHNVEGLAKALKLGISPAGTTGNA